MSRNRTLFLCMSLILACGTAYDTARAQTASSFTNPPSTFTTLPSLAPQSGLNLSLESSILLSLNQNPAVKSEMAKIKQAHAAIGEARSAYYPQISANIRGGHEYNDPAGLPSGTFVADKIAAQTNSLSESLVISQILYNGFATDDEVGRRKSLEQSATLTSISVIEGILQNAIQYYVDVWHYQRAVAESQAFVDKLEAIGQKINLMSAAGAESKAKKEYVDSRVANAHTELNKAKASLADAISNLESLTGPLPPFNAQRPLQFDPTARTLESYLPDAHEANTRLLINKSDHLAVDHQIDEQKASYLPIVSLDLEGRHGYDVGGHVGNTWNSSAMVVMDYKLFDGFSRDSTMDRLKGQRSENEFRQLQMERDLDKDIRKYYNQILATKQDLTSNMQEIISSETLQGLYKKQFELGEGDIITMIEGDERLHTAHLNSFKLESNMVIDSYTLIQKIGSLQKERFCASC